MDARGTTASSHAADAAVGAADQTPVEVAHSAGTGDASGLMAEYDVAAAADLDGGAGGARKRELEAAADEYEEEEEEDAGGGKDELKDGKLARAAKRSRRHSWQQKYEAEFGLLAIERDSVSGDVTLAMCGFCKAFGREGKYEQLVAQDAEQGNETKKRRRRSLTTTKFFRAFRVDNIRSHLQGAHPRRWAEYETLPKQDAIRARYLQMQGEFQYDNLSMVEDVVLGGSALSAESDMAYAQAQAQALAHSTLADAHHAPSAAHVAVAAASSLNGSVSTPSSLTTSLVYSGKMSPTDEPSLLRKRNNRLVAAGPRTTFDYEKHLVEQLALDRERLEFDKAKFKKEVELRERELALHEKKLEQDALLHEKLVQSTRENAEIESAKFFRLAEVLRESITSAQGSPDAGSVV